MEVHDIARPLTRWSAARLQMSLSPPPCRVARSSAGSLIRSQTPNRSPTSGAGAAEYRSRGGGRRAPSTPFPAAMASSTVRHRAGAASRMRHTCAPVCARCELPNNAATRAIAAIERERHTVVRDPAIAPRLHRDYHQLSERHNDGAISPRANRPFRGPPCAHAECQNSKVALRHQFVM